MHEQKDAAAVRIFPPAVPVLTILRSQLAADTGLGRMALGSLLGSLRPRLAA
jgi:hypothetical protein